MQDRNFDDIAEKFARNIYGTTKGKIRQAVVWQDLTTLLAQLPQRPAAHSGCRRWRRSYGLPIGRIRTSGVVVRSFW